MCRDVATVRKAVYVGHSGEYIWVLFLPETFRAYDKGRNGQIQLPWSCRVCCRERDDQICLM